MIIGIAVGLGLSMMASLVVYAACVAAANGDRITSPELDYRLESEDPTNQKSLPLLEKRVLTFNTANS